MSALSRLHPATSPARPRQLRVPPPARDFLFSGRGPLRRVQIEALRQRRSWLERPVAPAA